MGLLQKANRLLSKCKKNRERAKSENVILKLIENIGRNSTKTYLAIFEVA